MNIAQENFSYCIGSYWPYTNRVKTYAFGSEVFNGTMEDAIKMKEFIQLKTGEEKYIFKLVMI